jgi:DNA-binding MarR family transcriptional regulator/N-acetylglutamate synthase-like GNAT family acetyltransferase
MSAKYTPAAVSDARVDTVRRFNRFYTRQIGVLQEEYLASSFSLTEVRILYELAHRDSPSASDLREELGLDAGYLSRILRQFERRGLIRKQASESDRRRSDLSLTKAGQKVLGPLETSAREQVRQLLDGLSEERQAEVVTAMNSIENALAPKFANGHFVIRNHRPGDMGWVVYRHGALYAGEYGFDDRFEALVAGIVANFLEHFDPEKERCWIAERDGEIIGSVFLVKKSAQVAKLRLLLVEPKARGLGLGKQLVQECIRFARQAGYSRIVLWTQSNLDAARGIYQKAGFRVTGTEKHDRFGCPLTAETWELELKSSGSQAPRAPTTSKRVKRSALLDGH